MKWKVWEEAGSHPQESMFANLKKPQRLFSTVANSPSTPTPSTSSPTPPPPKEFPQQYDHLPSSTPSPFTPSPTTIFPQQMVVGDGVKGDGVEDGRWSYCWGNSLGGGGVGDEVEGVGVDGELATVENSR